MGELTHNRYARNVYRAYVGRCRVALIYSHYVRARTWNVCARVGVKWLCVRTITATCGGDLARLRLRPLSVCVYVCACAESFK